MFQRGIEKYNHVAARSVGFFLITIGVASNRYVFGFLSSDGQITSILFNATIVVFELASISAGIWFIVKQPPGSMNWAFAVGALLLGLLFVEILSITFGLFVPREFAERNRVFYHFFQRDSSLGFKLKPNLENFEVTWMGGSISARYDTDDFGFRNKNRNYSEAPVWFIGDSFTYGEWVDRESTFYGLLESRLDRPLISLGVPAYGITQYGLVLKDLLRTHRPHVVAICVFANDLSGRMTESDLRDYYLLEGWDKYESFPLKKRFFSYHLMKELLSLPSRLTALQGNSQSMPAEINYGIATNGITLFKYRGASRVYLSDSLFVGMEDALVETIEMIREKEATPIIFLFPSKESAYNRDYEHMFPATYLMNEKEGFGRIGRLSNDQGILCVDLTGTFRNYGSKRKLYYDKDPHWNEEGHRLAADEMFAYIRDALNVKLSNSDHLN